MEQKTFQIEQSRVVYRLGENYLGKPEIKMEARVKGRSLIAKLPIKPTSNVLSVFNQKDRQTAEADYRDLTEAFAG